MNITIHHLPLFPLVFYLGVHLGLSFFFHFLHGRSHSLFFAYARIHTPTTSSSLCFPSLNLTSSSHLASLIAILSLRSALFLMDFSIPPHSFRVYSSLYLASAFFFIGFTWISGYVGFYLANSLYTTENTPSAFSLTIYSLLLSLLTYHTTHLSAIDSKTVFLALLLVCIVRYVHLFLYKMIRNPKCVSYRGWCVSGYIRHNM